MPVRAVFADRGSGANTGDDSLSQDQEPPDRSGVAAVLLDDGASSLSPDQPDVKVTLFRAVREQHVAPAGTEATLHEPGRSWNRVVRCSSGGGSPEGRSWHGETRLAQAAQAAPLIGGVEKRVAGDQRACTESRQLPLGAQDRTKIERASSRQEPRWLGALARRGCGADRVSRAEELAVHTSGAEFVAKTARRVEMRMRCQEDQPAHGSPLPPKGLGRGAGTGYFQASFAAPKDFGT